MRFRWFSSTNPRRLRVGSSYAAILLAGVVACAATAGQSAIGRLPTVRADTVALRRALDSIADAHHGIVGYSVIDLETGARISRRGDETFPTDQHAFNEALLTIDRDGIASFLKDPSQKPH